ncbi:MAG: hypothetical protein OXH19_01435 [Chloroflexi bacterium]|nr:hypothetical protein [Chloroflexota bacterium]MCY3589693.1 hypothetical protein [Chloroflexota bacterium]MCY3685122.1 hypothetical protein [Chloroflexota bacterium]MDE2707776.1 hypothetical protein [Chloroflexota bacterium]
MRSAVFLVVVGVFVLCGAACRDGQDGQADKLELRPGIELAELPVVLEEQIVGEHFVALTRSDLEIGFRTALAVRSYTEDPEVEWATLMFFCDTQRLKQVVHVGIQTFRRHTETGERVVVKLSPSEKQEARASFGSEAQRDWRSWGIDVYERQMEIYDGTHFLRAAKGHQEVWVRFPLPGRVVETRFDLRGVFDTAIQPNLDHCGLY